MTKETPSTPVPSATILLLRPTDPAADTGLEVFMVVRHHQIDFASGALVFPGGKADPQDFEEALLPHLQAVDTSAEMRAIQVSAIREAFEECGVLLAYERSGAMISAERLAGLQNCREQINNGSLPFLRFLQQEKLILACDQLIHFAHWITPPMMAKRFDTHFYLALAPADHLAIHDGYESVDSVWITPQQAITDAEAGQRTIIFPTLRNLEKLGSFDSVAEAVETTAQSPVVAVMPWTESREDGKYLCIQAEAGYAVVEEKMTERLS